MYFLGPRISLETHLPLSSCATQEKNSDESQHSTNEVVQVAMSQILQPRSRSPPPCPPPPPPSPVGRVEEITQPQQPSLLRTGHASVVVTESTSWRSKLYAKLRASCSRVFAGVGKGRDYRGLELRVYVAYERLQYHI